MATELGEQLLQIGFRDFEGEFADGQEANNRVELDSAVLAQHPLIRDVVVSGLADLAEQYRPSFNQPQFIVGVPDGATDLAGWVAYELSTKYDREIYVAQLEKTEDGFFFKTPVDEDTVNKCTSGLIVEDTLNRRSSTRKVLWLPGMHGKILAVLAELDRGVEGDYEELDIPVHPLAKIAIPAMLEPDSPFRKYLQ